MEIHYFYEMVKGLQITNYNYKKKRKEGENSFVLDINIKCTIYYKRQGRRWHVIDIATLLGKCEKNIYERNIKNIVDHVSFWDAASSCGYLQHYLILLLLQWLLLVSSYLFNEIKLYKNIVRQGKNILQLTHYEFST